MFFSAPSKMVWNGAFQLDPDNLAAKTTVAVTSVYKTVKHKRAPKLKNDSAVIGQIGAISARSYDRPRGEIFVHKAILAKHAETQPMGDQAD